MTIPAIPNNISSPELDIEILTDPPTIKACKVSVAGQMTEQSGGPQFEDLHEVWSGPGGDGNVRQSSTGQTLAGFLQAIVEDGAKVSGVPIRFVALVAPNDPNHSAPLTTPASTKLPASNARANPNKNPGPLTTPGSRLGFWSFEA